MLLLFHQEVSNLFREEIEKASPEHGIKEGEIEVIFYDQGMIGTERQLLDRTLDYLLFVVLAVMSLTMAANVFCRFILNFSIYWADELVQVLMVWLTFLGAAVAVRENAHYVFDYLSRRLKGKALLILMLFSKAIGLTAIILLLIYSGKVTLGIRSWIMPALEVSRAIVYGACPAGCAFMLIYGIRDFLQTIKYRS